MRFGLWNLDHPESNSGSRSKQLRFDKIREYVERKELDVFVATEANAAMEIPGMTACFSEESPFRRSGRCYEPPNRYHQVGIYSRQPILPHSIAEPINGALGSLRISRNRTEETPETPLFIYGNVITIKDQWKQDSNKTYRDRLDEQITALQRLAQQSFIVLGDFNLRLGWKQKSYRRIEELVNSHGFVWPTKLCEQTVQQVIHSTELVVEYDLDSAIKQDKLSDHPFLQLEVALRA